jgi:leucyl-tRNA synthetase
MPILACADKLKDEIKKFGTNFEGYKEEEVVPEQPPAPAQGTNVDPTKFSSQKSKAAAKTIKAKYQFQVGRVAPEEEYLC